MWYCLALSPELYLYAETKGSWVQGLSGLHNGTLSCVCVHMCVCEIYIHNSTIYNEKLELPDVHNRFGNGNMQIWKSIERWFYLYKVLKWVRLFYSLGSVLLTIYFKIFIFILCVCTFCLHICMHTTFVPNVQWGQKRISNDTELEL